ncbi:MAG: CYCXC family (seleno)protein [Deltaproteobacteria bacterium]
MVNKIKKNNSKKWFAPVIIILSVIGLGGGYWLSSYPGGNHLEDITDLASIKGGETRPTMSPALFVGRASAAYAVAREIPEVLDHIHCYCECKKHHNHKSLLTCYVTKHGAECDICIDEAIRAYELYKEGKDILTIRKTIDKEFSQFSH